MSVEEVCMYEDWLTDLASAPADAERRALCDELSDLARLRNAVDAREAGADLLIMARTDARFGHGLEEAIPEFGRVHRNPGEQPLHDQPVKGYAR